MTLIWRWCSREAGVPDAFWKTSESEEPSTDGLLEISATILFSAMFSPGTGRRACPFDGGGVPGKGGVEELLSIDFAWPLS